MENPVKESVPVWKDGRAKSITFIVTKDCQLACKYCYLVGKNTKERMSFDVARQAVDYILSHREDFNDDSVVWDFIGGEPFLEIDLIDQLCDYIKKEMFCLDHPWFNSYRFSFSTNGINYDSEKVQHYIKKNHTHLSIGITIDGTRRKHDLNRVYKGSQKGSYDDVCRNIPLWLSQFPDGGTKVTISSADIPYIYESVLHLFSLGIHQVNINCVFEDVWKEGDDHRFEEQLLMLADEIIDQELYRDNTCTFFSENIGKPLDKQQQRENWCGAGRMLAVVVEALGVTGLDYIIIDNEHGPFDVESTEECISCEVASGCAWCQGENYDAAQSDTIYQRSTAICKMHKARVRANNYYWNRLFRKLELQEFETIRRKSTTTIC